MLEDPLAWTLEHGYPVLFGMLLFSGLGLPIPEDIPLIAAGVLAKHGGMGILQASFVCMSCVLCRDLAVYGLGRSFGERLLENRWASKLLRPRDLHHIEARMRRHGVAVVFVGRFLPGLRAAVFFAAGKAGIRPWLFFAVDAGAALVSIPAFILAGYLFAANIDLLLVWLREFRVLLIVAVLSAALVFLFRVRRKSAAESLNQEDIGD
ncbi:MAG: DedA family protein [Rickettsiales bacterium]|nr:DedA family protein [Rickettsiales bacterium]|tara:strand:- start:742 stop:1365 length:624 start_codon:yes stop_codon:yes gene_type:complete